MKKNSHFDPFLGKDSAEVSAEASVKMAEASVSAESHFRPIRSFTTSEKCYIYKIVMFLMKIKL